MPTPNQKLADSLEALRQLQVEGRRVFRSNQFKRIDRERLIKNGFLQEIKPTWLISSSPSTLPGDSTPWYASFWEFGARYCDERFGTAWYLSAEQSLLLLAEYPSVPRQVVVCSPKGTNNKLSLPFGTSLYDLKQSPMPPSADIVVRDGIRLLDSAAVLIRISETAYRNNPIEARVVLESIQDASEVLTRLLAGGHTSIAGRVAGAFRHIHRPNVADEIVKTMRAMGYDVRETNPFQRLEPVALPAHPRSPIVTRLQLLWQNCRSAVLEVFPEPPGLPADTAAYLKSVDDIYAADAYNSLSIEGYSVSTALVEQVRSGNWNPDLVDADRRQRDALAARGYWQAFQKVKADVARIIAGENPGPLIRVTHRDWYRELFQPCAAAGLINVAALAGYRNDAVYLRHSRHVPPRWEVLRDAMPALFDLIEKENSPAVRAVLGHWLFGFVHPYPDGNGRMARFLMNALLASGGYPWTVILLENRQTYLSTLEQASVESDVRPFALFLAQSMQQARS